MSRKVRFYLKSVYGNDLLYPDPECRNAEHFLQLIGRKTFNRSDLATIKALGYEVEQVLPPDQRALI